MAECKHKFVHRSTDSYYYSNGRYKLNFVSTDYYFCEKCLKEEEVKKQTTCDGDELRNLPDWAKGITKKVAGYEPNW